MKQIRAMIILVILLLIPFLLIYAQNIDEARMEQDIKVAQGILKSLIDLENREVFYRGDEGSYIANYGVILKIPRKEEFPRRLLMNPEQLGSCFITKGVKESWIDQLREAMQTFIVDYSDLIGQLRPTDKILILYDNSQADYLLALGKKEFIKDRYKLSAEIDRQSIIDYKSGRIDQEELRSRTKIREEESEEAHSEDRPDLKVMAGIFKTIFENDEENYYRLYRNISYDYIEGFGVSYELHFTDTYTLRGPVETLLLRENQIKRGKVTIIGDEGVIGYYKNGQFKETKDREQPTDSLLTIHRDALSKSLEKIEEEIKEGIVSYGRTLKSLDSDEVLLVKASLSSHYWEQSWDEHAEKKTLTLSIKKSVLEAYDRGEISLEEAQSAIKVKK